MKKVITILFVLLIILVLAGVTAAFFLGSIVKKGVETVGPQVAKVEVKLDSAALSLLSGSATLKGLLVGNPPGFDSPSAIKVGEISVGLEPRSVFSDKIVVHSISVIAPEITLHGLRGDNLNKILQNIQASTGGGGSVQKQPGGPAGPGKKMQVDDLIIKDGKVNLVLPMVGAAALALPEIHLTNVGKDSGGVTAPELSARVMKAILDAASAAAASAGADPAKLLQGGTKDGTKQLDKALKGVGNLLK
jgi:hypothetical protein